MTPEELKSRIKPGIEAPVVFCCNKIFCQKCIFNLKGFDCGALSSDINWQGIKDHKFKIKDVKIKHLKPYLINYKIENYQKLTENI